MANKTIQIKNGSDVLYPQLYHLTTNGTQSVASSTDATFTKTLTLPPGKWLVLAYVGWSSSSTIIYNINIWFGSTRQRTIRATMANGGGAVNSVVFSNGSSGTLSVSVWQNSGSASTATYYIDAIKIG